MAETANCGALMTGPTFLGSKRQLSTLCWVMPTAGLNGFTMDGTSSCSTVVQDAAVLGAARWGTEQECMPPYPLCGYSTPVCSAASCQRWQNAYQYVKSCWCELLLFRKAATMEALVSKGQSKQQQCCRPIMRELSCTGMHCDADSRTGVSSPQELKVSLNSVNAC